MDEPLASVGALRRFLASAQTEAVFSFLIVLPLLFVVQLASAGPALSFGFTLLYGAARWGDVVKVVARRWPLLLVPGLALASVIWSDYPAITLKHGLELVLTVLGGLMLSGSRRPVAVLIGVWAAFALFMAVSFALGRAVAVGLGGAEGEMAFGGLSGLKNLFGMTAALAVLTSLFVLSQSGVARSLPGFVLSGAALALELYLSYLARSAGALIALVLAAAAFGVTACLVVVRPRGRAIACVFLALVLGPVGALAFAFANSITATTLHIFHKDPTLTGRVYLWYRAPDLIREHPLLGRGFEAFWVQGNADAEGLWAFGGITDRSGFNFHNTLLEAVIHFGWIGASLLLLLFLFTFALLIRRQIRAPSLVGAFYIGFIVFVLTRTPFESLTPQPVDFVTLLLFAALGFGFEKLGRSVAPAVVLQPVRRPLRRAATRPRHAVWSGRASASSRGPQAAS